MKILYLAPDIILPGTHGGSAHVQSKLASLRRLGHDVLLVCRKGAGQRFADREQQQTTFRIPVLPGMLRPFSLIVFPFFIAFYLILHGDVHVVYERGRIFGGSAIFLASLFHVRSVYELNEPYPDIPVLLGQYNQDSFLMKAVRRWHQFIVRRATMITVTHSSLIRHGIAPAEKTIVITHGVDILAFSASRTAAIRKKYHLGNRFIVLYTGSFAPWHSCEQIVRAAKKLPKRNNITFLLVGNGEQYESCRKLAEQLGVNKQFIFTHKVSFSHMPDYVAAADVCLALFDRSYPPFKKYSFFYSPMKIMEYKASGKPIIASNFGNLKKLIAPGKNGFLVNEHDPENVAQALQKLSRNKALCKKIGQFNYQQALRIHHWDVINALILEKLEQKTASTSSF